MFTELLKKLGLPNIAVAVIAALVTVTPFLFSIDERYAKAEEMEAQIDDLKKQNEALIRELAQMVGFQAAMVQFIQEGRLPRPSSSTALVPVAPALPAPRVGAPPPAAVAPAPAPAPEPSIVVPDDESKSVPQLEVPKNWRELNEGLSRQQQRVLIPRQ